MLPDGVHLSDAYNRVGTHGIINQIYSQNFGLMKWMSTVLNSLLFETLQKQCQQFNTV